MLMRANWTFLTNHAWVLCIAHDPEMRLRGCPLNADHEDGRPDPGVLRGLGPE
jgi:hypothetical protein